MPPHAPRPSAPRATERAAMVRDQIAARGIRDPAVLRAMETVPRHDFVPEELQAMAYEDHPLAIGHKQTISQPFIVALMTELAGVGAGDKVLEIGTGSGYQAAVLAEMAAKVYSIEIVEALAKSARESLARYQVELHHGDGYSGWLEQAPFNAIIVTAAPPYVPSPLKEQLADGGRLVIPVGENYQKLLVIERNNDEFGVREVLPVRFVPMTGRARD